MGLSTTTAAGTDRSAAALTGDVAAGAVFVAGMSFRADGIGTILSSTGGSAIVARRGAEETGGAELTPGRPIADVAPLRLTGREDAPLWPRRPEGELSADEVASWEDDVSESAPAVSADATAE